MPFDFKILQTPYDRKHWKALLQELFPSDLDFFAQEVDLHDPKNERIESFTQFGNISLSDRFSSELALFEVRLKPRTTKLHINRVALREIVDKMRRDTAITGALAVFVDEELGKWRFTFIAKADVFGEKTVETTDPKRYTYVLGKGERTRTAEDRFKLLASKAQKSLEDIIEAFSVEKVNAEFFKKYKELYNTCWQYLAQPESGAYEVFKINPKIADDRARKPLRDFAKRLMGRLVFLYFLQKKGWMGCPMHAEDWDGGDPDFVAKKLFNSLSTDQKAHFYSDHLTQLFFSTLNKSRPADVFTLPNGEKVRVPYLNGGLFEQDEKGTEVFDFPVEWFIQVFDFFSQYNFTIDESSPNDQEIGIDPEMLGHIFENLLEENREKGAYYTPKEIVHYMCQESLLLYLKNELLGKDAPMKGIIWSDSRSTDEQELEHFVRYKDRGKKDNFIYKNGRAIEHALQQVRICDPAIGSGAFPMGLLYEIFHCHVELDLTQDYAQLKKDIIHHCIYGVDKDSGAVDIARLRFWLALVVDEQEPQPLPNLDFKIMQGDSLLESFEGIDLSKLMGDAEQTPKPNQKLELFSVVKEPTVEFNSQAKEKLTHWLDDFFEPQSGHQKAELQEKIESLINRELDKAIQRYKSNLLFELGQQQKSLARAYEVKQLGLKVQKEIARLEEEIAACEAKQIQLAEWQERPERPFFLWHTWFREVFDRGGFDIVIGNPPYIRQEAIKHIKPEMQRSYPLTYRGTADILVYFIELAYSKLLRKGGQFAFIVNNKWIRAGYGDGLRSMLQNTKVHQLLDFGDLPVFESAMAYPCILLFEKSPATKTFDVVLFENVPFKNDKKIIDEVNRLKFPIEVQKLDPEQWHLNAPNQEMILKSVNAKSIILDSYISGKIARGVTTGATDVFIIDTVQKNIFVEKEPESRSIIKPILIGRDLKKYVSPSIDRYLLFIPWHFPLLENEQVIGASVEAEKAFRLQFPVIYEYLSKNRQKLENRNASETGIRYEWYALQRWGANHYHYFEEPKIMYQKFQVSPCFIFDDKGVYCNDSMWFIPGDDKFLLGYLNSQMGWWCITKYCSRIKNGYQLMYDYLKNIPIPLMESDQKLEIAQLVDKILDKKRTGQDTSKEEAQIDALIFSFYGLKEAEMLQILNTAPNLNMVQKNAIQANFRDIARGTFKLAV